MVRKKRSRRNGKKRKRSIEKKVDEGEINFLIIFNKQMTRLT